MKALPAQGLSFFRKTCALLLVGGVLAGCATPRLGDDEAALVLEDVLARGGASRLGARAADLDMQAVEFSEPGRSYRADLYRPALPPRGALVLLAGLNSQGHADPRLVSLARSMARAGFLSLVPDLPQSRDLYLTRDNVGDVIAAVRYLRNGDGLAYGGPIGLGGISFASGPVLMAALDPALRRDIDFVVNVGGYYDLRNLVSLYTTGAPYAVPAQANASPLVERSSYLKWVIALASVDRLESAADRDAIRDYARRRLTASHRLLDRPPQPAGEDARALLALLANTDPGQVPALLARLSPAVRDNLAALDPAQQDLRQLRARVYLIHGRGDRIIPPAESIALARALPGQSRLFLLEGLEHVNFAPRAGDYDTMLEAVRVLLAQRRP